MSVVDLSIQDIIDLKNLFEAYTTDPVVRRILKAQCDAALELLNAGQFEAAHGAIKSLQTSHMAAGLFAFGRGVE